MIGGESSEESPRAARTNHAKRIQSYNKSEGEKKQKRTRKGPLVDIEGLLWGNLGQSTQSRGNTTKRGGISTSLFRKKKKPLENERIFGGKKPANGTT